MIINDILQIVLICGVIFFMLGWFARHIILGICQWLQAHLPPRYLKKTGIYINKNNSKTGEIE